MLRRGWCPRPGAKDPCRQGELGPRHKGPMTVLMVAPKTQTGAWTHEPDSNGESDVNETPASPSDPAEVAILSEKHPAERLVREVMSSAFVTVSPTATVQDALHTLGAHHLHCAPVLTVDGRLVGVVSEADLRRAIRLPALEAIDPAGCLHHQTPARGP